MAPLEPPLKASLCRERTSMPTIEMGDDEGVGDLHLDAEDRWLRVMKFESTEESFFAKKMEVLCEAFEEEATGWKWISVGRDGGRWYMAMLFETKECCSAYSVSKYQVSEEIVVDEAAPIRIKRGCGQTVPEGSVMWLFSVETNDGAESILTDIEEDFVHHVAEPRPVGFAVTKPFDKGTKFIMAFVFKSYADKANFLSKNLPPLLTHLKPIFKTQRYSDSALVCGYNDDEPEDLLCSIM